jgi:hypothetical protein
MISEWTLLSERVHRDRQLLHWASSWELPSDHELDAHKAALHLGVPSTLHQQFDWGVKRFPTSKSQYKQISQLLDAVRTAVHGGIDFQSLEHAIETQTRSVKSIHAEAYLDALAHRVAALIEVEDEERARFDDAMMGAIGGGDRTLQRYFHANWAVANGGRDLKFRANAEFGLAHLCLDIWQRRLAPWGRYPRKFFGEMINDEDGKPVKADGHYEQVDLKTPYLRATSKQLHKMVENRRIAQLLPPLNAGGFPAT